MKTLSVLLLLLIAFPTLAQNPHTLSLDEVSVPAHDSNFKALLIVDGRKDKSHIGWVQTGMMNKKRIARFIRPFDQELDDMFNRSGLLTTSSTGFIIRVTRLYINEITMATREIARAEVSCDLFKIAGTDSCYFVASVFGVSEQRGMDVTNKHADNIAKAFEKAILDFASKKVSAAQQARKFFHVNDLGKETVLAKDLSSIAILNTSQYQNGIFTTFEDFLNNRPSITARYEVREGKTTKLWRVDETGKRVRIQEGVYAFAKDNALYILFNKEFFPLERKKRSFQFIGRSTPDSGAVMTGGLIGGAIGGAIAGASSATRKIYEIDLDGGGFIEVGIVK